MSYEGKLAMAAPQMNIHPLLPGERDQQERLFRRNAVLREIFGEDRRAGYSAMSAQTPIADGVSIQTVSTPEASGWWIRPRACLPGKAILFVHGGGYHLGDAKSYLGFASQIAALTNCAVFSVDYALAPEHRFPAAYQDVLKARNWLAGQGVAQISAAGDSAGGALVLAALNEPLEGCTLSSVVAFSPWTDLANTGASFRDPGTPDRVFQPAVLEGLAKSYLGEASPRDPKASPLYGIPAGAPPIYIQVGQDELLLDDSTRYAQGAADKGIDVRLDVFEGMHHVFQRDVGVLKTSKDALDLVAQFIVINWAA
jgi:monoterpene epsilon-lactone hydrolase